MADKAPHVFRAISDVMARLSKEGIAKTQRNREQGYVFRGIDQVYQALCVALVDAQLVVTPRVIERVLDKRQSKSGTAMFNVALAVEFDFVSVVDGSHHMTRAYGESTDSADKATNKAMSAAYKYMALQAFCIPVQGEPDADATTPEEAAGEPDRQPAAQRRRATHTDDPVGETGGQEPDGEEDLALTVLQQTEVKLLLDKSKADQARFLTYYGADNVGGLKQSDFEAIKHALNEKILRATTKPAAKPAGKTSAFKGVRPS